MYRIIKKTTASLLAFILVMGLCCNMNLFSVNAFAEEPSEHFVKVSETEYHIKDKKGFDEFRTMVFDPGVSEYNFSGCTVVLDTDLDFDGENYVPVGAAGTACFAGTFDGNNKTIKNLKRINEREPSIGTVESGLFVKAAGTADNHAVIKNLTIEDAYLSETCTDPSRVKNNGNGVGILVGFGEYLEINNCTIRNSMVVNDNMHTGGVFGSLKNSTVRNCNVDSVTATGNGSNVGLLGGRAESNCMISDIQITKGSVTGKNIFVGGCVGRSFDSPDASSFSNISVSNNTIITGPGATAGIAGGIASSSLEDCYNAASVSVTGLRTAGIANVFILSGTSGKAIIEKCVNEGTITSTSTVVGGITASDSSASYASGKEPSIVNCVNRGTVSGSGQMDSIAYSKSYAMDVTSCYSEVKPEDDNNYTKVGYFDENVTNPDTSGNLVGFNRDQFKDRTLVDFLNGEDDPVWFQNIDYPDFADNMTPVSDITADETASVDIDQEITLNVSVSPADATNPALTFKSSDEEIATVDADGKVKGIKVGETDITITALYDGSQKVCKVTVKDPVAEKEKADKEAADKVIEMIKGIDITKATQAQLKAVQEAYKKLTADQRKLVDADPTAAAALKKIDDKVVEMEKASGTTQNKASTTVAVNKGTKFTVKGYKYKVTSNLKKNPTVTITGYKNKKLKKIVVPASVKYKKVTFKVTAIGKSAFKGQKKATAAVIGKNVQTIGATAFAGNANCKKITVKTTVLKKVGAKAVKGINKKAVIKVPAKKLKAYKKLFKGKGQAKTVKIKK